MFDDLFGLNWNISSLVKLIQLEERTITMKLRRHYLVEITNQGRLEAYQNLGSDYTSARSKLIEALIMNERIPGY